jgi:Domain of unknown function (DUF4276)
VDETCRNPILIVEGAGDVAAIPLLIRKVLYEHGIFHVQTAPRPKTNVEIGKLRQPGQLERYIEFCNRDAGDSIVIAIDSDDHCPVAVGLEFATRIKRTGLRKPASVCLFNREYESIFLPSIDRIVGAYPDFKWSNTAVAQQPEAIRDVKGTISKMMSADRAYKPTRDQARFTDAIDLAVTRAASRSFRHFEKSLLWLVAQRPLSGAVHPG